MNRTKILALIVTLLCIAFSSNIYAGNAKAGDGFVTCNLDGTATDKGQVFSKAAINVSNIDQSGNYIYKGVMVGTFKKGTAQWDLLTSNSIITNSLNIEVTNFGDITKYEYNEVYCIAYKIMYEMPFDDGVTVTTSWNALDGSYFTVKTLITPTIDTIEITGNRGFGEDATINATGTNISQAAYRIFYTKSVTVPLVADANNDEIPDGWLEPSPAIREDMDVINDKKISKVVAGTNLSNTEWTYVVFKVAVASSSGLWAWKFSPVYGLGGGGAGGGYGGYLNYVGHNQILKSNGQEVVVTAPDTPDPTYGPYNQYILDYMYGINKFANLDSLTYRLEFDVIDYQTIKDMKFIFDFNEYNERNVEIQPTYMRLVKRADNGPNKGKFVVLKDLVYTAQGVNRYTAALGNDNGGTPMIIANQAGRYAIEYGCLLKIKHDIDDTLITIRNTAEIRVCVGTGKYDELIEPDRPNNKFYIETKATRNVGYR